MNVMYILLNAAGERLYQYPATDYIDVAERYKRDYFSKTGMACRIATKEMSEMAYAILSDKQREGGAK